MIPSFDEFSSDKKYILEKFDNHPVRDASDVNLSHKGLIEDLKRMDSISVNDFIFILEYIEKEIEKKLGSSEAFDVLQFIKDAIDKM